MTGGVPSDTAYPGDFPEESAPMREIHILSREVSRHEGEHASRGDGAREARGLGEQFDEDTRPVSVHAVLHRPFWHDRLHARLRTRQRT